MNMKRLIVRGVIKATKRLAIVEINYKRCRAFNSRANYARAGKLHQS